MDCYCSAWPVDRIEAEDQSSPCLNFSFSLDAIFSCPVNYDIDVDHGVIPLDEDHVLVSQEISIPYNVVMGEETSRFSAISNMLLGLGVYPVETFMVRKILDCAGLMSANKRFAGRRVLRMEVQIDVGVQDEDLVDDQEDMDDEEETEPWSDGASKESIEELQKVKVEEGSEERCSICCEDFVIGFEATLMPCSHRFHGDCINKWLVNSKFCPLCRFELIN